jgi:hypothetical protein
LPQDQRRDSQSVPPVAGSDEDHMAVQPKADQDNMSVQPRHDRDSSTDNMAVRPQADQDHSVVGDRAVPAGRTNNDVDQSANAHPKKHHKKHHKKANDQNDRGLDQNQSPR